MQRSTSLTWEWSNEWNESTCITPIEALKRSKNLRCSKAFAEKNKNNFYHTQRLADWLDGRDEIKTTTKAKRTNNNKLWASAIVQCYFMCRTTRDDDVHTHVSWYVITYYFAGYTGSEPLSIAWFAWCIMVWLHIGWPNSSFLRVIALGDNWLYVLCCCCCCTFTVAI